MNYKFNEENYFVDITDGIAILIEIESGTYYGMNYLTTSIFENIINGVDTNELLNKLKSINGYDETYKDKYLKFIRVLESKEIIVADEENDFQIKFDCDELLNDESNFVLSEYRDVSDLLLADPIHQVKEDTGWLPDKEALK